MPIREILRHPVVRLLGLLLGAALLAAAVTLAVRGIDLRQMNPHARGWMALLALAVALNLLITSGLFWIVTRSFDAVPPVGLGRMTRLICASSLLNYLPLRPGLLARAAVLKTHHQLPVRQSLTIWLIVTGAGLVLLVLLGLALLAMAQCTPTWPGWVRLVVVLFLVAIASAVCGPIMSGILRRKLYHAWSWPCVKAVDLLVTALRLWLAFKMVNAPMSFAQALLAAAAGLIAGVLPMVPNGLGVREWIITLVTEPLSPGTTAVRVAATLIDRAVETLVIVPAGLVSIVWIRKKLHPPARWA